MKETNLIDENYKYKIINEKEFNDKYLQCNTDGSKYKKYLLICHKKDNNIRYDEVPNKEYLNRFTNIIKIYNIEEIISTCINFDSMYNRLSYFHVNGIYFMKYLINEDYDEISRPNNDYEILIDKLRFNSFE